MDRERFTSLPAATDEERAVLAALAGVRERRAVAVAAPGAPARELAATLSIDVAEPFDGKADVVARLVFDRDGPGADERPVEEAWDLLDAFLRDAEARARSGERR